MIINGNCTILSRSVDPATRLYTWTKTIYNGVYFEQATKTNQASEQATKSSDYCYCCIYRITSVSAKIGDYIVKGVVTEADIDITEVQNKYNTYSITSVTPCDMGNIKHIEIEGI